MRILDMTAGYRAAWITKSHHLVDYIDKREIVKPTFVMDSTKLPKEWKNKYNLIVLDPPHLNTGKNSNMAKSYGHHTTQEILDFVKDAGLEAHRVSKKNAFMALKWNDHDIKLERVFKLLLPKWEPLFGDITRVSKRSKTFWVILRRLDI